MTELTETQQRALLHFAGQKWIYPNTLDRWFPVRTTVKSLRGRGLIDIHCRLTPLGEEKLRTLGLSVTAGEASIR